jgi:chromate transport protein ChrA
VSLVADNFQAWTSWALFAAATIASLFFKVGPIPIIIAGGVLGLLIY